MADRRARRARVRSLPPRGAWIEMIRGCQQPQPQPCRSPHGERGLKYKNLQKIIKATESLPPRGAWIEIDQNGETNGGFVVAPPTGSVD